VLLARWLATRPRLLVLDEPARGIDVASKVEIQAHIAQLAREGVSVVYISSELEEVVRLSDRIVVFKDREKIGEVSNGPWLTVDTIVEMIAADTADDPEQEW
jgi:monosaccharide-transporting ATPase